MVDSFRRLLYDISKRLSSEEVIDLMYLCNVPQSAQTKIQDGKDLFKHLEESGVISSQRVYTLKKVLLLLRPKRQDLLDFVERKFPEASNGSNRSISICTTNTINTITSETSGYSCVANSITRPPRSRQNTNSVERNTRCQKKYFILDCYCVQCHGCSITKPFCCCYGTTAFLLFLLLVSVVFWFSGKPNTVYMYLNADVYRKDVGFVVVSVLVFLLIIIVFPFLIKKHGRKMFSWCNRKRHEHIERRRSLRNPPQQLLRKNRVISQSSEPIPRSNSIELNPPDQWRHENEISDNDEETKRLGNESTSSSNQV